MQLTSDKIASLLSFSSLPDTDPTRSRPVLVRHHLAGIYAGYLVGPGLWPDSDLYIARHIWRWSGALGTTALAAAGPGPGSSVGPWVEINLPREGMISACTPSAEALAAIHAWPVSLRSA